MRIENDNEFEVNLIVHINNPYTSIPKTFKIKYQLMSKATNRYTIHGSINLTNFILFFSENL